MHDSWVVVVGPCGGVISPYGTSASQRGTTHYTCLRNKRKPASVETIMNFKRHWRLALLVAAIITGGLLALTACGTQHASQSSTKAQLASWWNHYGKTEVSAFSSDDGQLGQGLQTGTLNSDVNADIAASELAALPTAYLHWPMPPVDPSDWRTVIVAQGKVGNDVISMNYDAANSDLQTVNSALARWTAAVSHYGITHP